MLAGVLTVCVSVFLAPLLCIQEVSGETGEMEAQVPEESLGSRGGLSSPAGPAGLVGRSHACRQ